MATIKKRKRKDGPFGYTAQIRIMRDGVQVYQESQAFDRQQSAKAWGVHREAELAEQGAIDRASRKSELLVDIIDRHLEEYERIPLGRTKRICLEAIGKNWLGQESERELTSQKLVEFAQWRISPEGGAVMPQTVGNELAGLPLCRAIGRPSGLGLRDRRPCG
ncbi:hypothetical protein [Metapseudomonas otitidis]|uniref:hypothetical protein n=1 Tax=Metapseudomonas otitidis TaxID=319939 RepID=UPI0035A22827